MSRQSLPVKASGTAASGAASFDPTSIFTLPFGSLSFALIFVR